MSAISIVAIDNWDPSVCSPGPVEPNGCLKIYYNDHLFGLSIMGHYTLTPKSIVLGLESDDEPKMTKFDQCMIHCYPNLTYISPVKTSEKNIVRKWLLIHPGGGQCFLDGKRVGWDHISVSGRCTYKIRPVLKKFKDKYTIIWVLLQIDVMRDTRCDDVLYDDTDDTDDTDDKNVQANK